MLAITGRDQRCGALVMGPGLVQFFVQLRRTGKGQRHQKGEQNTNPNASTRLHLPPRFHRGELARKKFLPEFESDRRSRNPAKTWIGGKTIRQLT